MEFLEFRPPGADQAARTRTDSVLRAYFEAQRARASRRFLWRAVPIVMLLLLAVQRADGFASRQSVAALVVLAAAVAAGAAVGEWRAARKLHALVRSSAPS